MNKNTSAAIAAHTYQPITRLTSSKVTSRLERLEQVLIWMNIFLTVFGPLIQVILWWK